MNANNHSAAAAKPSCESLNELRLSTARKRLAASRNQQDALEGLREIVGTFLGSEEIGLFTVDSKTSRFKAFWSFGIDLANYDLCKALGEGGRERVMRGEYYINLAGVDHSGSEKLIQAFIPIKFEARIAAILAIMRLLPQKNGFDQSDFELFRLLTNDAGAPLFRGHVAPTTSSINQE
jgi:hypothetical protein